MSQNVDCRQKKLKFNDRRIYFCTAHNTQKSINFPNRLPLISNKSGLIQILR